MRELGVALYVEWTCGMAYIQRITAFVAPSSQAWRKAYETRLHAASDYDLCDLWKPKLSNQMRGYLPFGKP